MSDDTLQSWTRFVAALPTMMPWVREGVALESCGSTQDECHERSQGRPGLVVTAFEQTQGRGQRGRVWTHQPAAGIAVTVSLDARAYPPAVLSLAGGLAAARAVRTWVTGPAADRVSVKWPNDVVAGCPRGSCTLKIAGVLVEVRDGLALVGVGVNVLQEKRDFPESLHGRAGSIRMLSEGAESLSRLDVLGTLLIELGAMLHTPLESLGEMWHAMDALVGTRQAFDHDGARYEGTVLRIDPAREIVLQGEAGVHRLPAMTSRLVKDDEAARAPCRA